MELAVRAAALPAAAIKLLVALAALLTGVRGAAALPASLATLTALTALTTLLFTISLSRIIRVRASHNTSNAKVNSTLANCASNVADARRPSHPSRG